MLNAEFLIIPSHVEVLRLQADNAALRADAERYRAIRYHACKPGWGGASFSGGTLEQCDMATDELVVKMNAALAPAKEQT